MSTAVYLRISEDRLGLELGIDRQRVDCHDLAHRRDWTDVVEYVDNDISATSGKTRPGYQSLIAAIDRGEVSRVVVWHPSRLWRNRIERARGIETMKRHRITLVCVKGPELDMSTAYGRGVAGLVGEFDTLESEVKAERVKRVTEQRARDGRHHGGTRLYGYTADGMSLVPDEAARVAVWFEQFLAGRSLTALAREAGCHPGVMRARLRNPRYAGLRLLNGQEYPAAWPAIVPREMWQAACAILDDPMRTTNGGSVARKHLGSGLYGCARCNGRKVYSAYYSSRGKPSKVYKCRPELGGCSRIWRMAPLDEYVDALVVERLGRDDLVDLLPVDRPDLDERRREATGIRERLKKLGTDYVILGLDERQVREANESGRARLAQIEAQLGQDASAGVLAALIVYGDPVAAYRAIPLEHVDRRQAVVRALMTITLDAPPRGRRWDPERFVVVASPQR